MCAGLGVDCCAGCVEGMLRRRAQKPGTRSQVHLSCGGTLSCEAQRTPYTPCKQPGRGKARNRREGIRMDALDMPRDMSRRMSAKAVACIKRDTGINVGDMREGDARCKVSASGFRGTSVALAREALQGQHPPAPPTLLHARVCIESEHLTHPWSLAIITGWHTAPHAPSRGELGEIPPFVATGALLPPAVKLHLALCGCSSPTCATVCGSLARPAVEEGELVHWLAFKTSRALAGFPLLVHAYPPPTKKFGEKFTANDTEQCNLSRYPPVVRIPAHTGLASG